MIGLEYLLLFGLPQNKLEVLDGKTRVLMAFPDPGEAAAHFQHWLLTLQRWQDSPAQLFEGDEREQNDQSLLVGSFELFRDNCVVHLRVPIDTALMLNNSELEYDREVWGLGQGVAAGVDRFDFHRAFSSKLGLDVSGTELLLTPDSMVAPIAYGFRERVHLPLGALEGERGLVGKHYMQGVPDLLAEVVLPASEMELRGEKMTLYREAGLPELWLLHPNRGSIEVYQRLLDRFALVGDFGPGQTFSSQQRLLDPADLLPKKGESRIKLWEHESDRAGLEHFLTAGTPFRHFDFYRGRARRWFACSTAERSQVLERQATEEIARWDPEGELFELLRVSDRLLRLNVRVDSVTHRRVFRYWHVEGKWRS